MAMNFKSWVEAKKGRALAIARHFGITQAAVSQWKTNGVPLARMKEVKAYTGDVVTLDDMVPQSTTPAN